MILQGALVHGFPSNNWTCARAAALLETTFGLMYTADHVGVLMKALGLSPQKPDKRSMKRDETKIQLWERETLPDLKKSSSKATQ